MSPTRRSKSRKTHSANHAKKQLQTRLTTRTLAREEAVSRFQKARERLHVSVVPESLPCRECEFAELYGYLESLLEDGTGGCIYISGVPGTGKTATTKAVVRLLQEQVNSEALPAFQFVEINGMKLTEPSQAYVTLYSSLTNGQKMSASHAEQLLYKRFTTNSKSRLPTVVVMDELDQLVTRKQSVMYNFFDWPNLPHSKLIVVAIANTMDLPERMLSNKISSRLGLTRITFQPYTYQQLIQIITSRLEGLDSFDSKAIELCARKVGAVSGDARRALDLCRRAVELFEQEQAAGVVQMKHIEKAVKEMLSTPSVLALQRCSFLQMLFIVALIRQIRLGGCAEVEFGAVAEEVIHLMSMKGSQLPSHTSLIEMSSYLGHVHLLLAETSKSGDLKQRLRLNVNEQDVHAALKQLKNDFLLRFFE